MPDEREAGQRGGSGAEAVISLAIGLGISFWFAALFVAIHFIIKFW